MLPLGTQQSPPEQQPSSVKLKLFISFGREVITIQFANTLHTDLSNNGYEVFLDEKRIEGGDHLSYELSKGIAECDAMIVILSEKYSKSNWCRKELIFADEKDKKLILIKRQECNISDQIKFTIEDRKWISFINDEEYSDSFAKLITSLEKVAR